VTGRRRYATRLSHRVAFSGRIFEVDRDRVRLPHGPSVTLDVVRHRGSVVLLPQPAAGTIILIRQYRYAIDRWIWELPAGSLEPGDRPDRAARRECEEEIGLRPRTVRRVGLLYPTPGFCDERMLFYLCRDLVRPARPAAGDADEDITPREFTIAAARLMAERGAITDMTTVAGLGMLAGETTRSPRR
jgi:ADP-ribose pyrophosphatase